MKYYKQLKTCFDFNPSKPRLDFMSYHVNTAANQKIEATMKNWALNTNGTELSAIALNESHRINNITKQQYSALESKAKQHQLPGIFTVLDESHIDVIEYRRVNELIHNKKREIFTKLRRDLKDNFKFNIFDNNPVRGFRILNVQERWSTSNKLFRVQDPRGYIVEISADNVCDLVLKGAVEYGLIFGKCVWLRNGRSNWLAFADHDETKKIMKKVIDK